MQDSIFLPENDVETAACVAEKMRRECAAMSSVQCPCEITASFGVAALPTISASPHHVDLLLGAAGAALYRSKHEGRNRVTLGTALAST